MRALQPGSGLLLVHDDTGVAAPHVTLPPVEMASHYERAQSGELARALPDKHPAAFSLCWPDPEVALLSRTRYLGGALGAEADLVTHELLVRRAFFDRGLESLTLLAGGPRSPFLDAWDGARAREERRRLDKAAARVSRDPEGALAALAAIACDPTVSTFPDERMAACLRAVLNTVRTGEPVVIEFTDREYLLRGAFGLDLPLSILLLAAAVVPPARAHAFSMRSWGWARTPELQPGRPAFTCIAVPESSGVPKRVLPGARLIRADGSTDRAFPEDGMGRLVTTAVAALRSAREGSLEEAPNHLRALRVLAAHADGDHPGLAAVWRAGRRAVPAAAIGAAVHCAVAGGEPAQAVKLLAERRFELLDTPELSSPLVELVAAAEHDGAPWMWVPALLAGLQEAGRFDLLSKLCDLAGRRVGLELPVLRWMSQQDELSRVLDAVAPGHAEETLRAAPCGALPHGYRALASLLRAPGKPSPRLRAVLVAGGGLKGAQNDVRDLMVALALWGHPPSAWDMASPDFMPLGEWLTERMAELLVQDAAAARRERRPRGPGGSLLEAHIEAAAACDGCGSLLKAAVSQGGRDLDAWILFLDRAAPDRVEWWARALATWRGSLGIDLRAVLPEVVQRAGAATPIPPPLLAPADPVAAHVVAALRRIAAGQHDPLPAPALSHAVGVSFYQSAAADLAAATEETT